MCEVLARHGCVVEAMVGSRMNTPGRADRYIAHRHWDGWIESKLRNKKLSPYQIEWHEQLLKRIPKGVYIVRFFPEVERATVHQQSPTKHYEELVIEVHLGMLTDINKYSAGWIDNFLLTLAGKPNEWR